MGELRGEEKRKAKPEVTSRPETIDGQRFPCPALLSFIVCFIYKHVSGLEEDDVQ